MFVNRYDLENAGDGSTNRSPCARLGLALRAVAAVVLVSCGSPANDDDPLSWGMVGTADPQVNWATGELSQTGTAEGDTDGTTTDVESAGQEDSEGEDVALCDRPPTYEGFAQRFFALRCIHCHSMALTGIERSGAPVGTNFDTAADLAIQVHGIFDTVLSDYTMPPGDVVTACEQGLLRKYIATLDLDTCHRQCDARECGPDGCGDFCGYCEPQQQCVLNTGQCENLPCVPDCAGAACGPDGCGNSCGSCPQGTACTQERSCECPPQCEGRACGDDACGGDCGPCTGSANECSGAGECICVARCEGKVCGDDGCGGSCGRCPEPEFCGAQGDVCECVPNCSGRNCGSDTCGGSCGTCKGNRVCNERVGSCTTKCEPDCDGRSCGSDACGGSCGECVAGQSCDESGQCVCEPDCVGLACGDDGCGGSCGTCSGDDQCSADGTCDCPAQCEDRECGNDDCGGSCGRCADDEVCADGLCLALCIPQCQGLECGADGCGATCGVCSDGQACRGGQCEWQTSTFSQVYPFLVAQGCGDSTCHGSIKASAGLDLSSESGTYTSMVGQPSSQCEHRELVEPGSPSTSYLIDKLLGVELCSGSRMPKKGPGMPPAEIDQIKAWIEAGALP